MVVECREPAGGEHPAVGLHGVESVKRTEMDRNRTDSLIDAHRWGGGYSFSVVVASPPRRLASCGIVFCLACGPSAGEVDGDGSGGTAGASGTSDDAGDHDASGADDALGTGTTGDGLTCPASDLPDPFCHVFVSAPLAGSERWVGYIDQVRDGVRPLLIHDEDSALLRLVSPLDPSVVLDEAPVPDGLPDTWEIPVTADFNGDGVWDFVAYDPRAGTVGPHDVAVVDGETFEVIGALLEPPAGSVRSVTAVDVDGDGASELISIERDDNGLLVTAWRPDDGTVALVQDVYSGLPESDPSPEDILRGDFDGDGVLDFSITWHDGTEPYWSDEEPRILTVLGESSPESEAVVIESVHPAWARSAATADLDGDGDSELIVAHRGDEIAVMKWEDGGFVLGDVLALPAEYSSDMARVSAGALAADGLGGLITKASHEDDAVLESRTVALFGPPVNPSFVPILDMFDNPTIADFDGDGFDDAWDPFAGLYLSMRAP